MSYGKYVTRTRFEEVLKCLLLSKSVDIDEQVLN